MMRLAAAFTVLLVITGEISEAQPPQGDQFKIEVAVDLVNVNFSATDSKGRMISGLTAQDFIVEEDGKPQTITLFAREQELPLTLGVLIDISPSVTSVFDEEKTTASRFLESVLGKRDLATVIAFDKSVLLVQDYTEDLPSLTKAISGLKLSRPGTSLYDAIYLAAGEKLAHEAGRKAIVLISDGQDTTSTYTLSKALIAAHKSDVVIYTISNSGNSGTLRTLAEETGGAFYRFREKGDFEKVFQEIAQELRTQYSIAYHSTNAARDGSYRKIKIIARKSDVKVRSRRGYYAPGDSNGR
jgi:VWFA-related protein